MPTAIITGASNGIGRELSLECARAGYDLVLIARNRQRLEAVSAQAGGRQVRVIEMDLTRAEAPAEVLAAVSDLLPEIEILINNAGVGLRGLFHELDPERQLDIVRLNIYALTALTRLILPSMVARRGGRVLNVASTAAFQPGPLMAVYYASKAYVLSLSEALHNELRATGVTVTALCPGPTATGFEGVAGMSGTRLFRSGNVMDPATVARAGFRAMMKGRPLIVTGGRNRFMAFMTRFAPIQTTAAIARRLQE